MLDTSKKIPGPDHPIEISPNDRRVIVTAGGRVIADSHRTLTLAEANYPAVHYIPRRDIDMTALRHSANASHRPYKGDASYFSLVVHGGEGVANIAWSYEHPYAAVSAIEGHLAFYPDRIDGIEVVAS